MKILELMTGSLKTCRATDMLDHAAKLMWDFDIGVVPVIDEVGQIVGIVTDRDLCMAAYTQRQPLHCVAVSVAMTKHVVTCRPNHADADVAKLMARHKVRRIPVVDEAKRPIGIVSLTDLALAMTKGRDVSAREVAGTLAAICERRAIAGAVQST
jgi:CBS domain-containing protein